MAIQTRTTNAGPVGLKPKGDYSASATYTLLDCVKHNHDSWVCKAMNAQGEAITITGQAPSSSSQYWQALTDGGSAAYEAAATATEKAGLADTAATAADTAAAAATAQGNAAESKGNTAKTQGDYAKAQGDYAKDKGEHTDEIRSDGYVYRYDPDEPTAGEDGYYRTSRRAGIMVDASTLTNEQIELAVSSFTFASIADGEAAIAKLR